MDNTQRNKRLRLLTKKLNRQRKRQAKKLDILCNDFIAAHRDFIRALDRISFAADFYESLIATTDLQQLLSVAANHISRKLPGASVAFFLRGPDSFELHLHQAGPPDCLAKQHFENCFTPELVEDICQANKICTIEDMVSMGLQGNPQRLGEVSAVTLPLAATGPAIGFILVYSTADTILPANKLDYIRSAAGGLTRAIQSCRNLASAAGRPANCPD